MIGGAVQGLGAVLVEEMVHDDDGQPLHRLVHDYGLLTAADMPAIAAAFVESPSPHNPLGAKGDRRGRRDRRAGRGGQRASPTRSAPTSTRRSRRRRSGGRRVVWTPYSVAE